MVERSMPKSILIYGGTFDPPHYGHLKTARAVQAHFNFDEVRFLPCKTPLLKQAAKSTPNQRVAMLKAALFDDPFFTVDLREIERDTPSFMVETLESIRQEGGGKTAIILLLGTDTFIKLQRWYRWEHLLLLSHLLIINRSNVVEKPLPNALLTLLQNHKTLDKTVLKTEPSGKIHCYNAGRYAISSTCLRKRIKARQDITAYIPPKVYDYIKSQGLYL